MTFQSKLTRKARSVGLALALGLALVACTPGPAEFSALVSRYLPSTSSGSWSALAKMPNSPKGSEHLYARSKGGDFFVHLFDFNSPTLASAYYERPVGGFASRPGPTGIPPPSRSINLTSICGSATSRLSICSVGVGTIVLRSHIVIIVYWLSHTGATPTASSSNLTMVAVYVRAALSLLSREGLIS